MTWKSVSGTFLFSCLLIFFCFCAHAQTDAYGKPAGFARVVAPGAGQRLASTPFLPFDNTIAGMFQGQMVGESTAAAADKIVKWDAALQAYKSAFKAGNTGDAAKDGKWFEDDVGWTLSGMTLSPGESAWLQNQHSGATNVFLMGRVVLDDTKSVTLAPSMNLFAYPYTSKVALNGSSLRNDGANGAETQAGNPDIFSTVSPDADYWLLSKAGDANDGKWLDVNNILANEFMTIGRGYWYNRRVASSFTWTESRPYQNPFNTSTSAPSISGMSLNGGLDQITLSIACTGANGEKLEIFFKDLGETDALVTESGWQIAAVNIQTNGATSVTWTDAGEAAPAAPVVSRGAVTGAFMRLYMVSRQDIDSDSDGLSDGRETFVYGTNPENADSDGDGIGDGAEVNTLGTNPNNIDTDGDGMPDNWEVQYGLDPKVNDAAGDFDGDGLSNLQEFTDGTNPTVRNLPTPQNLKFFQEGFTKVVVKWDAVPENRPVQGYKVYRDGVEVGTTTSCVFTDTGLTKNTSHSHTVKSYYEGILSDASVAVSTRTMKSPVIADIQIVEQAVDWVDALQINAANLISKTQEAFAALGFQDYFFQTLDGTIISTFVSQEMEWLSTPETAMTEAERILCEQETQQMLATSFNGHSMEEVYLFSKLVELGDMHWQAGKISAAEALYEKALEVFSDVEALTNTTLWQMARFKTMPLNSYSTTSETNTAVAAYRQTMLRYFTYFTAPTASLAANTHASIANEYFKNFYRLLKYDNYTQESFDNALASAQAAQSLADTAASRARVQKVAAWELTPSQVTFKRPDGTLISGELAMKNISSPSLFFDNVASDERTFSIAAEDVSAPLYKGHSYTAAASFQVPGGNPLKYEVSPLSFAKGKKTTYNFFAPPVVEDLADPAAPAKLVFVNDTPTSPYNLAGVILADTFTLSWDWTPPSSDYQLQCFKIYRGGVEIASPSTQSLAGIPIDIGDMTYTYTARALDVNGVLSTESRPVEVLPPALTAEMQKYYAWKTLYFGSAPYYDYQDPDGDGLTNYQEYKLGTNPLVAPLADPKAALQNVTAGLRVKYFEGTWTKIPAFDSLTPFLDTTITYMNFARAQTQQILTSGMTRNMGAVFTGYFDVPKAGFHRLYLTNCDGARISIDNTTVIEHNYVNYWITNTKDIYLDAGTHCFRLDYFNSSDYSGLAVEWAGPEFKRKNMQTAMWHTTDTDTSVLTESILWKKDSDWDGVKNVEELSRNTLDNNADSDNDGLGDYDEVNVFHTNPLNADTDGDGVSDLVEVRDAFSNPNVADFNGTQSQLFSVDGASFSSKSEGWAVDGAAIYAVACNGWLEYSINVTQSGVHRLDVAGKQRNLASTKDNFVLDLYVDGSFCGTATLKAPVGSVGTAMFFLPELAAGSHAARIVWRNIDSNTFLQVNSLALTSVGGTDGDQDGMADWIENRLAKMSGVTVPATSRVSPLCVEGDNATFINQISISGYYTPPEEQPVPPVILRGAKNKWYSDVPLSPTGQTNLTVSFQSGAKEVSAATTWIPTNIITDGSMSIRRGDSLLLAAHPNGAAGGSASVTVDGQTYTVAPGAPVVHKFESAGSFVASATYTPQSGDPVSAQVTIKVVGAAFAAVPYTLVGCERSWSNPSLPSEAFIEYDDSVIIFQAPLTGGGRELVVAGKREGDAHITARLGENGPVMTRTRIDVLDCRTHKSVGYYNTLEVFSDGSSLIEGYIILTEIPDDLSVKIRIYTAGVTFEDGTIERVLTKDDFDANGLCRYRLLKSASAATATCNGMWFYQGSQLLFSY